MGFFIYQEFQALSLLLRLRTLRDIPSPLVRKVAGYSRYGKIRKFQRRLQLVRLFQVTSEAEAIMKKTGKLSDKQMMESQLSRLS